MTGKADFSAADWKLIIEGPGLAGMHVLAAEQTGIDTGKASIARSYARAREEEGWGELMRELLAESPRVALARFATATSEPVPVVSLEPLRAAAALVDEHAGEEEATHYRHFVLGLAQHAAEARRSGFLGLVGRRITDRELKALDEIAAALGVSPAE